MAKFVISRATNGQYYFTFDTGNNKPIVISEMYMAKQSATNGANAAKAASPYDGNYARRIATNGQPYFVLKASNGEVLATSETYSTTSARDAAIETMKKEAPTASIVDNA